MPFFNTKPLVVDIDKVTEGDKTAMLDALTAQMTEKGADPERVARARKLLGDAMSDISADKLFEMSRASVEKMLEESLARLEGLANPVQALAQREALAPTPGRPVGLHAYELGGVAAGIEMARGILSVAHADFRHALDCPCRTGGEHPEDSERPTEPPPPAS